MDLVIVLDCADPRRLARFWTEALAYETRPAEEPYVALVPKAGHAPDLLLQRVPEPKRGKNRMHLDLRVPDIDREAARLIGLGARRLSPEVVEEHGFRWYVMADPEGNEFCVIGSTDAG